MRWFRTNRFSGWLALFALAIQLAVSLGHVHLDRSGTGQAAEATTNVARSHEFPPGNVPDADEFCAICAVITLSGSLVVPEPPAIVVFRSQTEALLLDRGADLVARYERGQFQARAPPV
jgi:Protein of unknown function (DUF2946)